MVGNYFKVATRSIQKRKLYSFINAFGLSIGIAFCILIYLFIQDERSFDQFQVKKDRIYRIEERFYNYWNPDLEEKDRYSSSGHVQTALKQALKDELPEVEYATRFNDVGGNIVKYGANVFSEAISYVDADFFKMFSFKLLSGNADRLFQDKMEVVLTPEIAWKYFGEEDPIGKILIIDQGGEKSYTVTGLVEKPPANSSIDFMMLMPQENRQGYEQKMTQWGNINTSTIVQLVPDADLANFTKNLDKVVDKYLSVTLERWRKDGNISPNIKIMEYQFTQMPDWHLKKEIDWHKVSDPQYSYILGGIATLILLIAGINYISLALTSSAARRTEVGIRKVVGALKKQLVYQFGFESIILAIVSMIIGFGLVILFLPAFNTFTGKAISLELNNFFQVLGVGFVLAIFIGAVSGSYPALFLSGFSPASVLKGRFTTKLQAGFTKPLVVLQFALSAFLIISSLIMYQQMKFVTTKKLGYDQSQILVIPTKADGEIADKMVDQFRVRLQHEPNIISVAGTSISFNQGWSQSGYKIDGEHKSAYVYAGDPHYIPTLSIQMVRGRNFDANILTDGSAVIVNEALVKDMKWTDPLNSYLNWREDTVGMGAKVIGVVKDYHYRSLEAPIEPMLLTMDKNAVGHLGTIMVKMAPGNVPGAMEKISNAWQELYPDKPYDYTFLDDDVAKQYKSYKRWMSIMGLSTGFAILISCLGLFGLAGINAVNRTKEIGIRKVMGAELSNIFILLNKQYIWLSLIAFSLAIPFSWYVMNKWLADFTFRIEMGWELFAISLVTGLGVALLTVSYHAVKAALVNPAETLKYE